MAKRSAQFKVNQCEIEHFARGTAEYFTWISLFLLRGINTLDAIWKPDQFIVFDQQFYDREQGPTRYYYMMGEQDAYSGEICHPIQPKPATGSA